MHRPKGEPEILQAAALRYDPGQEQAPRLVARGSHLTAQRILDLAAEHGVPVRHDPTLVSVLGALEVGTQIPPELYGVIAEVLAWAYYSDKGAADNSLGLRAA